MKKELTLEKIEQMLPNWFLHKEYGKVYCYDAETSDKRDLGLSGGIIHYGYSEKHQDRLGWVGASIFKRDFDLIEN